MRDAPEPHDQERLNMVRGNPPNVVTCLGQSWNHIRYPMVKTEKNNRARRGHCPGEVVAFLVGSREACQQRQRLVEHLHVCADN